MCTKYYHWMCELAVWLQMYNFLLVWSILEFLAPWKVEKRKFGNNVILQICTNYHDHCMYVSVNMVADGQSSIILVTFWPFYSLAS